MNDDQKVATLAVLMAAEQNVKTVIDQIGSLDELLDVEGMVESLRTVDATIKTTAMEITRGDHDEVSDGE